MSPFTARMAATKREEMELEKLTLGELNELKSFLKPKKSTKVIDGGVRIVILQRGWVFVGRYSQQGSNCKLEKGYNVRKWGTTKGLGEIALSGPTKDTVLDAIPNAEFHELTVIATLQCVEDKWLDKCPR